MCSKSKWTDIHNFTRLTQDLAAQDRYPMVNGAGRAGWHAGHAMVALVGIDHVVARIMRDGAHRTNGFTGIASNADLGVYQVLFDNDACSHVHGLVS